MNPTKEMNEAFKNPMPFFVPFRDLKYRGGWFAIHTPEREAANYWWVNVLTVEEGKSLLKKYGLKNLASDYNMVAIYRKEFFDISIEKNKQ